MTDIRRNIQDNLERPVVSMCCITYNHVDTIAQCLDGMLMQEVDVPVEIVVHDDASTDGTAEIVADYMARYPRQIRAILRKENQFSQGRRPAALAFAEARGDYMALCEGDDFWTDPTKIARQLAALEANPSVDMCAHAVRFLVHDGKNIVDQYVRDAEDGVYETGAILNTNTMLMHTATLFVRRAAALSFIDYVAERPWLEFGDQYLKFFGSERGGALFMSREMASYRSQWQNSWSQRNARDTHHLLRTSDAKLRSFAELAEEGRFRDDLLDINYRTARRIAKSHEIPFGERINFLARHTIKGHLPAFRLPRLLVAALTLH